MNLFLVSSLVAAAMGFGAAWQLQGHRLLKLELEQSNGRIAQQRAARATLESYMSRVNTAQIAAQNRAGVLAAERNTARLAVDGLRDAAAAAMRTSSQSLDACNTNAATQAELLAVCADRYIDVAATAQGHYSDTQTLMAAWPK